MESNQLNNQDLSNDAIIELLTLTCKVDSLGTKRYFNKQGKLHRIYGPAVIHVNGRIGWLKNGLVHREDGPAVIYTNGEEFYYLNDKALSKEQFIQWQKKNGIKPNK